MQMTSQDHDKAAAKALSKKQSDARFIPRDAAAAYLRNEWALRTTKQSLAKLACCGGGPVFYRHGKKTVVYRREDLDEWAESKMSPPMRSTSDTPTKPK